MTGVGGVLVGVGVVGGANVGALVVVEVEDVDVLDEVEVEVVDVDVVEDEEEDELVVVVVVDVGGPDEDVEVELLFSRLTISRISRPRKSRALRIFRASPRSWPTFGS